MQIDLDPGGRKVVIFGDPAGARQAVRRFQRAGAIITLVTETPRSRSALLRLIGPAWLIVDMGLPLGLRDRVHELAGYLHALVISEEPAPSSGQVTLIGGGSGRTSRLTLEACAALRRADAVLYDRLTAGEDLDDLAPGAELVDVGSSPLFHPGSPSAIGAELVDRARRGESVVRLKGGDSLVFGRGGEEMLACVEAGVPVRIVPGISGAPAAPVTAVTQARAS